MTGTIPHDIHNMEETQYEVTRNHDEIVAANAAGTINAASYEDVLYGYPMTADNGYYLYYDKSVLTEDDVKTLDGILAAANVAGKQPGLTAVEVDMFEMGWQAARFMLQKIRKPNLQTQSFCTTPTLIERDST